MGTSALARLFVLRVVREWEVVGMTATQTRWQLEGDYFERHDAYNELLYLME